MLGSDYSMHRASGLSDADFLRGSLHEMFSSWEEQDMHVLRVLEVFRRKPRHNDVLAIPATLNGVRQNGYYLGSLQRRKGRRWVDFFEPLSLSTFILPPAHADSDDSILFRNDVAYIPIGNLIFSGDQKMKMTLSCTVDEHIQLFLKLNIWTRKSPVAATRWLKGRTVTLAAAVADDGTEEEDLDNLSELDDIVVATLPTLKRCLGQPGDCRGNKKYKKKVITEYESGSGSGSDEENEFVGGPSPIVANTLSALSGSGVSANPDPVEACAEQNPTIEPEPEFDTATQRLFPPSPVRLLSLELFAEFECTTWEDIDSCIKGVNETYANISSTGFVGLEVFAVPVAGPAGCRGYLMAKCIKYDPATECLTAMILLPISEDGTRYIEGYEHAFHGIAVGNGCVPVRASRDSRTGIVTLRTTLEAAFVAHLSIEICVNTETKRVGKGKYPAEKKITDSHKTRQNKAIYQAVQDIPCTNAIVLDSVGYCTSSLLISKGKVARIFVPNNSEDCARMQKPPAGVVLLPGVTLLQEIRRWDVAVDGFIGCLVADTCRQFNEDLRLTLDAAFLKFADKVVLSITVSTRSQDRDGVSTEIVKYVRTKAKENGFVNTTGAKVRQVGVPFPYGSNMLFLLFSLRKHTQAIKE